MKLVVVYGAATKHGRMAAAIRVVMETLTELGDDVELIDLAEAVLPPFGSHLTGESLAALDRSLASIRESSGVILASPVYRASYSGVLKNFLDYVPVEGLLGKPVAIVGMGESPAHALAIDVGLRPVLAWFGAFALPNSLYLSAGDFTGGELTEQRATTLRGIVASASTLMRGIGQLPADSLPDVMAVRGPQQLI